MSTLDKIKHAEAIERELKSLRQEIKKEQSECEHSFGACEYTPYRNGIIDYHGFHMHRTFIPQWKRRCMKCGYIDTTEISSIAATWK